MCSIQNNELWREFFQYYKDLSMLWDRKPDVFINRVQMRNAWQDLLTKYREIQPDANVNSVKERINRVRCCYRRELKKVILSIESGAEGDDIYKPNLWYYDDLDFLKNVMFPMHPALKIDLTCDDQEEELQQEEIEYNDSFETTKSIQKSPATKDSLEITRVMQKYSPTDVNGIERNSQKEEVEERVYHKRIMNETLADETNIYAESWATTFRKLTQTQQIFARKAIEDIFALGQLERLTLHTVKNPFPPTLK